MVLVSAIHQMYITQYFRVPTFRMQERVSTRTRHGVYGHLEKKNQYETLNLYLKT